LGKVQGINIKDGADQDSVPPDSGSDRRAATISVEAANSKW